MKKFALLISLLILIASFWGCEQQPVTPEPENSAKIDPAVIQLAVYGWNANRLVNSGSDIEEVVNISQILEEDGSDEMPGIGLLKKQAVQLSKKVNVESYSSRSLKKALEEVRLFFIDDTAKGVRKALFYDNTTGIARYYEAKYKFFAWQNLVYDSSHVVVDLKNTLNDTLDDEIGRLYRHQEFKEAFFIQKITNDLNITDTDGKQPTGVEYTKQAYYRDNQFLQYMKQFVDLNPDKSGLIREDYEFKDGKKTYKNVKFYPDNTGEFSKKLRDGTTVSGTFNGIEDDGEGYFTELTDYPDGRYVDTIDRLAKVSITLPDSIITINLRETILYSSGKTKTDSSQIITQEMDGEKNTTIHYFKDNGEHGSLHIVETEIGSTLNGHITTVKGEYVVISAEYYLDESGHVHFEVYQSEQAYNNGDDPILIADYYFSPDGSGEGTIIYLGQSFEVAFDDSGEGRIGSGSNSKKINMFE